MFLIFYFWFLVFKKIVYPHFTPHQIKSLKKASQIAAKTFEQIKKLIRPGWTEKQTATQINRIMKNLGATKLAFRTIVAAGSHSSEIHHKNTTRKVRKNDIILLDFGCKVERANNTSEVSALTPRRWRKKDKLYLCSDFSRTIFMGTPKSQWLKIHQIVKTAQKKAINYLKSSIINHKSSLKASKLDAVARDYIKSKGYGKQFPHDLGHGIGNKVHQYFKISPKSKATLKPGFVFTIEPGIYLKGKFGVRIEDIIYLSPQGPQIFTKLP